ncbi:MAG: methionyl-tRNA formyltransferase [Planctomycetota bacterium]
MRIIMFGTGPFAVPTFKALLESEHEVPLLVTRPISDPGKRRKSAANPTRDAGEKAGVRILDPDSCNDEAIVAELAALQADLFVVCDYGQILSRECLAAARLGGINLHGSLLPKYRGAAPINWAIYNGDTVTGVTVIHMSARLDAGNCLTRAEMPIGPDQTTGEIEPLLSELGVKPVLDAIGILDNWDGDSTVGQPQDKSLATKAPRLKKSDGAIDWTKSAVQIRNQIRAFQPWPGCFALWHYEQRGKQKQLRLIVHRATVLQSGEMNIEVADVAPGQVAACSPERLIIQTGEQLLSLDIVQPAGKSAMPVADFLRGRQPAKGDWFMSPEQAAM